MKRKGKRGCLTHSEVGLKDFIFVNSTHTVPVVQGLINI